MEKIWHSMVFFYSFSSLLLLIALACHSFAKSAVISDIFAPKGTLPRYAYIPADITYTDF
jgi:hypothetical protein